MADARGFDFPFRAGDEGFPQPATDITRVGSQLRQVLLTEVGERLMRPTFGARLRQFLFETIDSITLESIRAEVARALLSSDVDVLVLDIQIQVENLDSSSQPPVVVVNVFFDRLGRRGTVGISLSPNDGIRAVPVATSRPR